jgi:mRNA interferase HigB
MICKFAFGNSQVHLFICWIGTHAEYTKLCNAQTQYTISNY